MNWYIHYVPNFLTLLRCLATIVIIYGWSIWWTVIILPLVIFWLLTDYLDGAIARKWEVSTQFGKQFDHYADKFFIISLFVVAAIQLYPYQTLISKIILWCLLILIIRDIAIWWFKIYHTKLPVLTLAKRKTTLQWAWLIAYFASRIDIALVLFLIATLFSLVSAYWYRSAAKGGRWWIDSLKLRSALALFWWKKSVLAVLDTFPTLAEFQSLTDDVKTLIVDLDGTMSPFDRPIDEEMYSLLDAYTRAWIKIIVYSNTTDIKRLKDMQEKWLSVYTWSIAKPHKAWYEALAKEFRIDLDKAVMIWDSPITDIPYPSSDFLAGVVLVRPITPDSWSKAWMHYWTNTVLNRFVKVKSSEQ